MMLNNTKRKKLIEIIQSGKNPLSLEYFAKQKEDNQKIEKYREKRRFLDVFKSTALYILGCAVIGAGIISLNPSSNTYNQLKNRNQELENSFAVRAATNSLDDFIKMTDKNMGLIDINKNLKPFEDYLNSQKDKDYQSFDKIPKSSDTYLRLKDNFVKSLEINGKKSETYNQNMPLSQLAKLADDENKKQIQNLYRKYSKVLMNVGKMKADISMIEDIQKQNENRLMENKELKDHNKTAKEIIGNFISKDMGKESKYYSVSVFWGFTSKYKNDYSNLTLEEKEDIQMLCSEALDCYKKSNLWDYNIPVDKLVELTKNQIPKDERKNLETYYSAYDWIDCNYGNSPYDDFIREYFRKYKKMYTIEDDEKVGFEEEYYKTHKRVSAEEAHQNFMKLKEKNENTKK